MAKWMPPSGIYKLNFDGLCKNNSTTTALSWDSNENTNTIYTFNLEMIQIYLAEALTLHKGLQVAVSQKILRMIIEGNRLQVDNSVKGHWNNTPSKWSNYNSNISN